VANEDVPTEFGPNRALFYGDNLDVLRTQVPDSSVDLCYIDPPFNSKRNYNQIYNNIGGDEDKAQAQAFVDTWKWDDKAVEGFDQITSNEQGRFPAKLIELVKGLRNVLGEGSLLAYFIHMSLRIVEIFRVLRPTGSFYLHCDPSASHYLKLACDAVFCSQSGEFQNEIIWRRTGSHNKVTRWGPIHDVILFYTKSQKYTWNNPKRAYMRRHVEEYFVLEDGRYRTNYYGNVLTGSDVRGGESGKVWKGFDPTAKGRHWAIPGALLEGIDEDFSGLTQHQKLDRLYELGAIKIVPGEAWPMYERYITESDGQAMSDIWAFQPYTDGSVFGTERGIDWDVRWLGPQDQERLGYPTQKPEGLLERIISASTHEGDVVLDAYCGCGTTVAVAQRLKRSWVGIDITYQSIALILKRLEDLYGKEAAEQVHLSGIPKDLASAQALAHRKDDRLRKEFEKWAVLTYSENRAVINEKKGSDEGIDGVIYFKVDAKSTDRAILQVKSGAVGPRDIRDLRGTVDREKAALGVLIVMEEPTESMRHEAKVAGTYEHKFLGRKVDRLTIVTVQSLVSGKARFEMPMGQSALKTARRSTKGEQGKLL
jgi:DNA modification methylase